MILIINTAATNQLTVILAKSRDDFQIKKLTSQRHQAEQLLPLIEKMLTTRHQKLSALKALGVVSGPGGFTALRIGLVTANTLAYALKIPVVGLTLEEFSSDEDLVDKIFTKLKKTKKGEIVLPVYGREPNINKAKKQ